MDPTNTPIDTPGHNSDNEEDDQVAEPQIHGSHRTPSPDDEDEKQEHDNDNDDDDDVAEEQDKGRAHEEPNPLLTPKTGDILEACTWRDVLRLRDLAESEGGFLSDELRQSAWPILLGLPPLSEDEKGHDEGSEKSGSGVRSIEDWKSLPRHPDEDQVGLDVNRSFVHYPPDRSSAELEKRKQELSDLIAEVLRRHPFLCYFQGYHDICQVFVLVLSPVSRAKLVSRLSVLRIRDFMLPSLAPTTSQLRLLPDILAKADPELRQHVAGIEPFYALAGTLTLYAHNIEGYRDIARLFDVILSHEPIFTIYMFAQIVINRREEILEIDEPDLLQVMLGRIPPNMDLNALITSTASLFASVPPQSLRSWPRISPSSVLKTARDPSSWSRQTIEEGHRLFEKQAQEVRWAEVRERVRLAAWRYRRPARTLGVAVFVSVVAFYVRRNPAVLHYLLSLFRS